MKVGSLFSGIGGFDLGLQRAGMEIAWQVEIDPFCCKVLEKHWPEVKRYGDIKAVNGAELEPVDLICGGFPCQPFSCAGKQRGKEDDRYLWPEMLRIIKEIRPRWVIGENVPGIINMALDQVLSDLEEAGYGVQTFLIPACGVDAPHRRERAWIVAYSNREYGQRGSEPQQSVSGSRQAWAESQRSGGDVPDTAHNLPRESKLTDPGRWPAEPDVGRVADGVPGRVDRLKSLGNAVVPQIPEILGRFILETEAFEP